MSNSGQPTLLQYQKTNEPAGKVFVAAQENLPTAGQHEDGRVEANPFLKKILDTQHSGLHTHGYSKTNMS